MIAHILIYFQYLIVFKAFTNVPRVTINQKPHTLWIIMFIEWIYISPNKWDTSALHIIPICTCKSFHDENSAHKYCKDEASLHCEFSDVLSK